MFIGKTEAIQDKIDIDFGTKLNMYETTNTLFHPKIAKNNVRINRIAEEMLHIDTSSSEADKAVNEERARIMLNKFECS